MPPPCPDPSRVGRRSFRRVAATPILDPDAARQGDDGPDGRDPDLPVPVLHLAADDPLILPFIHELPGLYSTDGEEHRRSEELRHPVHDLSFLLAGRHPQRHVAADVRVHRHADRNLPGGPARPRDARHAHLPERVLHPGRAVAGRGRLHLAAPVHVAGVHQQRPGPDRPGQPDRLAGQSVAEHLGRPGRCQLAPRRLRHGPLPGRAEERRSDAPRGGGDRWRERPPDLLPGRLPGDAPDQHRHRRGDRHRIAARVRHRLHHQPGQERPGVAVRPDHQHQHRRGEPPWLRVGHRGRPAGHLPRADRHLPDRTMRSDAL